MGSGGYNTLEEKIDKLIEKFGKIIVVNGSTNEEVDLTEMTRRTILWLVGRAKQDKKVKNRFVVEGIVADVLEKTVHKFHILFQFSSLLLTPFNY